MMHAIPSKIDFNKLDTSPYLISAYDRKLKIIAWNKSCEKKFHISSKDAVGKSLFDIFPNIEKDYRVQCLKQSALEGKDFYFSGLPYLYRKGFYSQVIIKINQGAIMIAADQEEHETISRGQLLSAIL